MWTDTDYGVYGKGDEGYLCYSQAMDRIREAEESRKTLMDEFDCDCCCGEDDCYASRTNKLLKAFEPHPITPSL